MAPDKHRKAGRDEFEAADSTRKVGRPRQRKLLQRRLDDPADSSVSAASNHADDPKAENYAPPPREDRAG